MRRFINLTPHDIHFYPRGKDYPENVIIFPRCEKIVGRCIEKRWPSELVHTQNGDIIINSVSFLPPEDLPPEKDDTMYIVSRFTQENAKLRKDLIFPDEVVRDNEGRIIGCTSFARG